jgi:hypothetical protein
MFLILQHLQNILHTPYVPTRMCMAYIYTNIHKGLSLHNISVSYIKWYWCSYYIRRLLQRGADVVGDSNGMFFIPVSFKVVS